VSPADPRWLSSPSATDQPPPHYRLRLYVAGRTTRSISAIDNLTLFCETHLAGRHDFEVIDLVQNPKRAAQDQIVAIPTLVCLLPPPVRRVIGDLSNTETVLAGLAIIPSVVATPS
jgi:circadian clock protein KaiB